MPDDCAASLGAAGGQPGSFPFVREVGAGPLASAEERSGIWGSSFVSSSASQIKTSEQCWYQEEPQHMLRGSYELVYSFELLLFLFVRLLRRAAACQKSIGPKAEVLLRCQANWSLELLQALLYSSGL